MGTRENLPAFQIEVQPSPETNDHEVRLLTNDKSVIEYFSPDMMGMDPDDLLIEPCPLRAGSAPRQVTIARCYCGVVSCGNVQVEIRKDQDFVIWTDVYSPVGVQFPVAQYDAEVERALQDFSWETPDRTAGRLIREAVDRTVLARNGFSFTCASGRVQESIMTAFLNLVPGPYQILVNLPWDGKNVESIVTQFKMLLAADPKSWPNVECYPQALGLGRPPIHGPAWRV